MSIQSKWDYTGYTRGSIHDQGHGAAGQPTRLQVKRRREPRLHNHLEQIVPDR